MTEAMEMERRAREMAERERVYRSQVVSLASGEVEKLRRERDALKAEVERWKLAWLAERHERLLHEPKGADYAPGSVRVARLALARFDISVKEAEYADAHLQVRLKPRCCQECKRPL